MEQSGMMMMGFAKVPNMLFRKHAKVLGLEGIGLYTTLAIHADSEGKCWPSTYRLADALHCSRRTISKYLRLLEAHGFITLTAQEHGSMLVTLTEGCKNDTGVQITPVQNLPQGGVKMTPEGCNNDTGVQITPVQNLPQGGVKIAPEGCKNDTGVQITPVQNLPQGGVKIVPGGRKNCPITRTKNKNQQQDPISQSLFAPALLPKAPTRPAVDYRLQEYKRFTAIYPRMLDERQTLKNWKSLIKAGVDPGEVLQAAEQYAAYVRQEGIGRRYIISPANFIGQRQRYREFVGGQDVSGAPATNEGGVSRACAGTCRQSTYARCATLVGPNIRISDEEVERANAWGDAFSEFVVDGYRGHG